MTLRRKNKTLEYRITVNEGPKVSDGMLYAPSYTQNPGRGTAIWNFQFGRNLRLK